MDDTLIQIIDWIMADELCVKLLCRHLVKTLFFDKGVEDQFDLQSEWQRIFDRELRFCVEIHETPSLDSTVSNGRYHRMIHIFGWEELGTIRFEDLPFIECRMFFDQVIEKRWFAQTISSHASMKKDVLHKAFVKNDFLNALSPTYRQSLKEKLKQKTLEIAQSLAQDLGDQSVARKIAQCNLPLAEKQKRKTNNKA